MLVLMAYLPSPFKTCRRKKPGLSRLRFGPTFRGPRVGGLNDAPGPHPLSQTCIPWITFDGIGIVPT
jgi:hypothetical protein